MPLFIILNLGIIVLIIKLEQRMAIGYVYLMTNGIEYKIGLTASEPDNRRKQLQTGNSASIDLIAYTVCADMNSLETQLHHKFSAKRKIGEWFALTEQDVYAIYTIFERESINLNMSLIPDIKANALDKDINELMKEDGIRMANGESALYTDTYSSIDSHEQIVIDCMLEEEKKLKKEDILIQKNLEKKEKEKEYFDKLIEDDAIRTLSGKKPINVLKYQKLENWKIILDNYINRYTISTGKMEYYKELASEYLEKDAKLILSGREPDNKYVYIPVYKDKWEEKLYETVEIIKEKKIKDTKDAKELRDREPKRFQKYIDFDKKRVRAGMDPIYSEYYKYIIPNWEDMLKENNKPFYNTNNKSIWEKIKSLVSDGHL